MAREVAAARPPVLATLLLLAAFLFAPAGAKASETVGIAPTDGGPPLIALSPQGAAAEGSAARTAATAEATSGNTTSPLAWTTLESLDDPTAVVVGTSANAEKILYHASGAYWVIDRFTRVQRRVDTYFDGTPLPHDVLSAAISGDGDTVVLLRNPDFKNEPTLRVVKLDGSENYEITLPEPGEIEWLNGERQKCYVMRGIGKVQLDDDGRVAWLPTSPCYYDRLLAIDIDSESPRWRFVAAFSDNLAQVTGDGRSFALGGDFFEDRDLDREYDPDEPIFTLVVIFPIEFDNYDARIGNASLDWPPGFPPINHSSAEVCGELPYPSGVQVDGGGQRLLISTDKVGLDPDTVVYSPGRQLYWADRSLCQMHSLGTTTADTADELRMSVDGRRFLEETGSGVKLTELATGASRELSDISFQQADPYLLAAATAFGQFDPGTGEPLGSLLKVAQLSGSPTALKVAILGDSYISGEGTYSYEAGTNVPGPEGAKNLCHRSVLSWAYQLGRRLAAFRLNPPNPLLRNFACAGATTGSIEHGQYTEPSQIENLTTFDGEGGRHVDLVFVTAGGNDAGFKSIVQTCMAIPCLASGWKADRLAAAEAAAANVETTLERIKDAAPHATVFLTGYPSIVDPPDGDCQGLGLTEAQRNLLGFTPYLDRLEALTGGLRIDEAEQTWLNGTLLPTLNQGLGRAAKEAGVRWINPAGWFHGHGVCQPFAYGNGLVVGDDFPPPRPFLGNESFHPNQDGYAAMAARVEFAAAPELMPDNNPVPIPQGIHDGGAPGRIAALVVDGRMEAWGDEGRVTIQGLPDGTQVAVGMYSSPTLLGRGTAGADGSVSVPYRVPDGLYPGLHTIVAYDEQNGEALEAATTAIDPPEECLSDEQDVDGDEDGLADRCDASLTDGPGGDPDDDGVDNALDICPEVADPGQLDADGNGVGDACDPAAGYDPVAKLKPFPEIELPRPRPLLEVISTPAFYSPSSTVEVAFAASSPGDAPSGPTLRCDLDGFELKSCTSPLRLEGLAEGYHSLDIRASGLGGETVKQVFWWVDTVAPTVTATTPAAGQNLPYGTAFTPQIHCQDIGSGVKSCSWAGLDVLASGPHLFTATATDFAGNSTTAEVPYSVGEGPAPSLSEVRWLSFGDGDSVSGGGSARGRVELVSSAVKRSRVELELACPGPEVDCPGVAVRVSASSTHPGRHGPAAPTVLGHSELGLAAGEHRRLRIPLRRTDTQTGRSAKARNLLLLVTQQGVRVAREHLQLKRPKR